MESPKERIVTGLAGGSLMAKKCCSASRFVVERSTAEAWGLRARKTTVEKAKWPGNRAQPGLRAPRGRPIIGRDPVSSRTNIR